MVALNFPSDTSQSPYTENGITYEWDGKAWNRVSGGGGGGDASITVSDTPPNPGNEVEGELWWDSSDDSGRLFVWYDDGNTQQWVETSPSGVGGAGGAGSGLISTGSNPPEAASAANEGMLWYNENDGQLYVSYTDGDSSQWINASPSAGSGGGYWMEDGGALKPTNSANNVEIGGGDIQLNADGSAEFASTGTFGTPSVDEGVLMSDVGFLSIRKDGAFYSSFNIYNGSFDNAGRKVAINNDGSAEFASFLTALNFSVDRNTTNNTFAGALFRNAANNAGRYYFVTNGNQTSIGNCDASGANGNIQLFTNGNATFAGNVTAPNVRFNLEPDNDANYTVTTSTDEEGNEVETRVYNGPTLDVKDRILNLISRLDAIEANEVVDDATDTSLLQLVANASARLDSIEARLTAAGI